MSGNPNESDETPSTLGGGQQPGTRDPQPTPTTDDDGISRD